MASYLRPRRGKKATAIAQLTASAPLKRGEVFFEVPDAGTGTGVGRIKMGDGSTAYESLPYFLEPFDPDSATVGFTDASAAESDPYTTNATHTNAIVPSANFKTIFTNLKQLLLNYNSQFTKLNNDLTHLTKEPYIAVDAKPTQAGEYQLITSYVIPEDGVYDIISYMAVSISSQSTYNNAIFINPDNSVTTYKEGTVTRSSMFGGGGSISYMITSLEKGDNVKVFAYTGATCNAQARLTVARRF